MEEKGYLIDSNVIIDFLGTSLSEESLDLIKNIFNAGSYISVITVIEVLGFKTDEQDYSFLKKFIDEFDVVPLEQTVVNRTIEIRKKRKVKLPDAIIAASAMEKDLILLTRNFKDFDNIDGLKVLNPYKP